MKRRQFLGMAAAAPVAGAAGWMTAEVLKEKPPVHPAALEPVLFKHDGTDLNLDFQPGEFTIESAANFQPKMTFYHDSQNRAEVYFDETTHELVLENKVTGKVLRV